MAINCDPNSLAQAARCFCFDSLTQERVSILLLCEWANGGVDPPPVNLNNVTWSPDNLMVDYDIGGGTVTATMAQFNLVDPTLVVAFAIENLGLDSIINLNELVNLEELRLSGNDLTVIPTLPTTLTLLDASNNDLTVIPALPSGLVSLYLANNQIVNIPAWPSALVTLDLANNTLDPESDWTTENLDPTLIAYANVTNNSLSENSVNVFIFWVQANAGPNGTALMEDNAVPGANTVTNLQILLDAGWTLAFEPLTMPAPSLSPGGLGSTTIDLNWSWDGGHVPAIDGFEIRWGIAPGVYETGSDTVGSGETTYQITGLDPETTYYIVVRSVSPGNQFYTAGNGPNSNEIEETTTA